MRDLRVIQDAGRPSSIGQVVLSASSEEMLNRGEQAASDNATCGFAGAIL